MANSLSKKISIFPISFDRSEGVSYKIWEVTSIPDHLTDEEKSFLKNNLIVSTKPGADYISYYEEKLISANPKYNNYANGRVLSEKNISTLVRSLADKDSFVVNASFNGNTTTCNYIEFLIRGRYFSLDLTNNKDTSGNSLIPNNSALWVGVKFKDRYIINDLDNIDEYEQLFAYDKSESDYDILAEVDFFITAPNQTDGWSSSDYSEYLQLLELIDGRLRVPTASQFKFTSRSIENINGGTV